jgi:hypothetical protein
MAGYSGTPLVQKLGIKAEHCVAVLEAPGGFSATLGELPPGATLREDLRGGANDVIVFFTRSLAHLRERFGAIAGQLAPTGGLWVAWPKKASGVPTDLSENLIRTVGLDAGLVDNKVCAVDDTWSGLRFVVRLKDRPQTVRHRTPSAKRIR